MPIRTLSLRMGVTWDQLELPLDIELDVDVRIDDVAVAAPPLCELRRSPLGTYPECPMCGGDLAPEHAHFRCSSCGWRDSCCD